MSDGTDSSKVNSVNYMQPVTSISSVAEAEQMQRVWERISVGIQTFADSASISKVTIRDMDPRTVVRRCVACNGLTQAAVSGHDGKDSLSIPCHDQCLDAVVTMFPDYFKIED